MRKYRDCSLGPFYSAQLRLVLFLAFWLRRSQLSIAQCDSPMADTTVLAAALLSADGEVQAQLVARLEAEAALRARIGDPRVAYVNIHTARPGCWLTRVEKI